MQTRAIASAVLTLLVSSSALAADLTGSWEIQSMGGDRAVTVEHAGSKLVAHRVLWPEFEGKKYKLEHLYRGTVKGNAISGELLVKDNESKQFEVLRTFDASITGPAQMTLDGFLMKKKGARADASANAPPRKTPPRLAKAPPPKAPPRSAKTPPKAPPPPTAAPPARSLIRTSETVKTSSRRTQLIKEGDAAFAAGSYDEAMAKYRLAAKTARGFPASIMHRIGRTHLKLKEYVQAQKWLKRAMRLDPANRTLREEYARAKAP